MLVQPGRAGTRASEIRSWGKISASPPSRAPAGCEEGDKGLQWVRVMLRAPSKWDVEGTRRGKAALVVLQPHPR